MKKYTNEDLQRDIDRFKELERYSKLMKPKTAIEKTLSEREETYGDFFVLAEVAQTLKHELLHDGLSAGQREAIEMICTKLARICIGSADHIDSWHDIAGYAQLVVRELEK